MDILVDTDTGDAVFINGAAPSTLNSQHSVAQRLFVTLRTFAGEWYLNGGHGIPYFQSILGKKVSINAIDLIFQQKILEEDGVQELVEFSSSLSTDRVYSMKFKVRVHDLVVDIPSIEVGV